MNYKPITINKDDIKNPDKFKMPKYQRNMVWSKSKRIELIRSVLKGFPVGAILVFEKNNKLQVIDGLQRLSTLQLYYKNPKSFSEANEALKSYISDKFPEDKAILVISWLESNDLEKYTDTKKFSEFLKLNKAVADGEISQVIDDIQELFKKEKNSMDNLVLSGIQYTGNSANLPEIFEKLNSQGTQLSKFDILASSWLGKEVSFDNPNIRKKIVDRFENMYSEIDVDVDFDSDNFEPSAFDFCYGFGEILIEKFPRLFNSHKGYKVSPYGFNTLSLYFFDNVSEISKLDKKLSTASKEVIAEAVEEILKAAKIADEALSSITINALTGKNMSSITEYQLYAHIGYLMKKVKSIPAYKNNAWKIAYQNILSNLWSGSGDSKVNRIMNSKLPTYESAVNNETFETIVDNYLESENASLNKGNISAKNRLTWSVIFSKNKPSDSAQFDIEHIVPKGRFDKKKDFPIGSVCNFTFLAVYDNRKKGSKTIWEDEELIKSKYTYFDAAKIIREYFYPTKGELNFVASNLITPYTYEKFLENREMLVKELIKKSVE